MTVPSWLWIYTWLWTVAELIAGHWICVVLEWSELIVSCDILFVESFTKVDWQLCSCMPMTKLLIYWGFIFNLHFTTSRTQWQRLHSSIFLNTIFKLMIRHNTWPHTFTRQNNANSAQPIKSSCACLKWDSDKVTRDREVIEIVEFRWRGNKSFQTVSVSIRPSPLLWKSH